MDKSYQNEINKDRVYFKKHIGKKQKKFYVHQENCPGTSKFI